MNGSEEIRALEEFVLNNPELERLEGMLDTFNVFETLKIVNVELKHSNFLAWLLNPNENHSFDSYFLRQFLKTFYSENKELIDSELSLFDFEIFDYSDVEIRREWRNIDLLILIRGEGKENKKVAIAIENKIKSSEGPDQLSRYKKIVDKEFEDYIKFFIFLTPEGLEPSEDGWIPFHYEAIAGLLEDALRYKKDYLSDNVYNFIDQYKTILRRYIVGNGEIEDICRKIYSKHQKALDLIFEYRPDFESQINEYLTETLHKKSDIIIDSSGKTIIRFTTKTLDTKIKNLGDGWGKSGRILMYVFEIWNDKLKLRLYIGPGNQDYREKLHKFCLERPDLFNITKKNLSPKWHTVLVKTFISLGDEEIETIKQKIEDNFEKFFNNEMKEIDRYFEEEWI
ncbi:MAG TPA: PD-(D/E)XK nuclease family protein [Methanofastidiosum sp.]|nr:PD-(D/E)XK nuclease family protein [Methanofastidiosum sp.]HQK62883.1 PD-(D/E)XK nuclease family protein [Methanofastidiosum sp.]